LIKTKINGKVRFAGDKLTKIIYWQRKAPPCRVVWEFWSLSAKWVPSYLVCRSPGGLLRRR